MKLLRDSSPKSPIAQILILTFKAGIGQQHRNLGKVADLQTKTLEKRQNIFIFALEKRQPYDCYTEYRINKIDYATKKNRRLYPQLLLNHS